MTASEPAQVGHTNFPEVPIFTRIGLVVSEKIWSETHIHSHGGGGYLNNGTGYVSGPLVTGNSVEKRTCWLRDFHDNTEKEIDLTGMSLPLRQGHILIRAFGCKPGEATGDLLSVFNIHTGQWHNVDQHFSALATSSMRENSKDKNKDVGAIPFLSVWILVALFVRFAVTPIIFASLNHDYSLLKLFNPFFRTEYAYFYGSEINLACTLVGFCFAGWFRTRRSKQKKEYDTELAQLRSALKRQVIELISHETERLKSSTNI